MSGLNIWNIKWIPTYKIGNYELVMGSNLFFLIFRVPILFVIFKRLGLDSNRIRVTKMKKRLSTLFQKDLGKRIVHFCIKTLVGNPTLYTGF